MEQKDEELLLKDLCTRLLHNIKAHHPYFGTVEIVEIHEHSIGFKTVKEGRFGLVDVSVIKPYLRKLSSMTEEDCISLSRDTSLNIRASNGDIYFPHTEDNTLFNWNKVFDWLNANHFDYRGLIPMGFAIEAPEGMYN